MVRAPAVYTCWGFGVDGVGVIKKLRGGVFGRSVTILAGGTSIAQALALLALPFLTRIYTPDDFGLLGSFAALLSMVSIIAALRYEVAIPLPEEDSSAFNLVVLSMLCVAFISCITAVVVGALYFLPSIGPINSDLKSVLWLLPVGVALTGLYSTFQYWAVRKKAYSHISRTRIEQSVGGIVTQIVLGLLGVGGVGLVFGQVVINAAGFFGLFRRAFKEASLEIKKISRITLKESAYKYRRFPFYSSIESFSNLAGFQLPLIFIAFYAGERELGFLLLIIRVLQGPMSLVGGAITQVYYGHAAEKAHLGELVVFTRQVLLKLFLIGVLPMLGIALLSPFLTPIIFGANWARAGDLAVIMVPSFFLQFMSAPVSTALYILDKQVVAMFFQIFGFAFRLCSVLLFTDYAVIAYAASSAIFYFLYLSLIWVVVVRSEVVAR